jgi:hypothetical protein
MRPFTASLLGLTVALPLGFATVPARADNDNVLGRAQEFFQNWGNNSNDRNAYERGRQDEWQRNQARRDRDDRYDQAQREDWRNRDRFDRERADRWNREHEPQYGYNGYRRDNE